MSESAMTGSFERKGASPVLRELMGMVEGDRKEEMKELIRRHLTSGHQVFTHKQFDYDDPLVREVLKELGAGRNPEPEEEQYPERLKRGTKGVRHNPKAVGRPRKVGVEKGRGPRHADNAKEGEEVSTDTVPAMLTPREAVMNRNAAELLGRGNIEALNAQGNQLAKQGVDLAGGKNMKEKSKKMQGGNDYVQPNQPLKKPPGGGLDAPQPGWQPPKYAVGSAEWIAGHPQFHQNFFKNPNTGAWQPRQQQDQFGGGGGGMPGLGGGAGLGGGPQPMPLPYPVGSATGQTPAMGGGFYPPNQGVFRGQSGISDLSGPAINEGFGPPPQLSAPDISGLLQKAGKEQGLTSSQIAGLTKAFSSFGGGGGMTTYGEGSATSQALGPALEQAFPGGYQGGISDIGYPPFVAPQAVYHGDKGGWQGRYDPNYFIPNYG